MSVTRCGNSAERPLGQSRPRAGARGALAAGRLVQPFLFGVTAADPAILAGTAAMLLVCVVSATLLPTRTAARSDPPLVLRSE